MFNFIKKIPLIKYYYRIKLKLWACFNLSPKILIANTNYEISAHNWQVAIPCRIDTTKIIFEGKVPKKARMIYEPIELPIFEKFIKNKNCFFDIGCNIGYYSHIAAAYGVKKIVAFEFMPEYSKFAQKSFFENKIPVQMINRGVGDPIKKLNYGDPLAQFSNNNLVSLDNFAFENNIYPDFIKMDIEGSEFDALKNAHEVLSKKPDLNISVHPLYLNDRGQDTKDLFNLLDSYGYKIIWSGGDTYFMSAK